jgi:CxxC motif-containing protein
MVGSKSRGNFPVYFCIKIECKNRDIKCNQCIRYSEYKKEEKNEKS